MLMGSDFNGIDLIKQVLRFKTGIFSTPKFQLIKLNAAIELLTIPLNRAAIHLRKSGFIKCFGVGFSGFEFTFQ